MPSPKRTIDAEDTADALRRMIEHTGMSQKGFFDAHGLPKCIISQLDRRRRKIGYAGCSTQTIVKIAEACGYRVMLVRPGHGGRPEDMFRLIDRY